MDQPVLYLEVDDIDDDVMNDVQQTITPPPPPPIPKPPKLKPKPKVGVLSQTVIPSPAVQFILPARLPVSRNCVVLVGETSLQVKEVVSADFRLENVDDVVFSFDSAIMAANVVNNQVVALTLRSKELVFLDGSLHFSRPMPSYIRYVDSFGQYLAVDPR